MEISKEKDRYGEYEEEEPGNDIVSIINNAPAPPNYDLAIVDDDNNNQQQQQQIKSNPSFDELQSTLSKEEQNIVGEGSKPKIKNGPSFDELNSTLRAEKVIKKEPSFDELNSTLNRREQLERRDTFPGEIDEGFDDDFNKIDINSEMNDKDIDKNIDINNKKNVNYDDEIVIEDINSNSSSSVKSSASQMDVDFGLASRRERLLMEQEEKDRKIAIELQRKLAETYAKEKMSENKKVTRREEEDFELAQRLYQQELKRKAEQERRDLQLARQLSGEKLDLTGEDNEELYDQIEKDRQLALAAEQRLQLQHKMQIEEDERIARELLKSESGNFVVQKKGERISLDEYEVQQMAMNHYKRQHQRFSPKKSVESKQAGLKQFSDIDDVQSAPIVHAHDIQKQQAVLSAAAVLAGAPNFDDYINPYANVANVISGNQATIASPPKSKPKLPSQPKPNQKMANKPKSPSKKEKKKDKKKKDKRDIMQPLVGKELYDEELFEEPPKDSEWFKLKGDKRDYTNIHLALEDIIADEIALLEAAPKSQHEIIKQEHFHQKMFLLMQLPPKEQARYHGAKGKSKRELKKERKKMEQARKKAEKEMKKKREKELKNQKALLKKQQKYMKSQKKNMDPDALLALKLQEEEHKRLMKK